MYQLTEYMLYQMILNVGEIYCKRVVIFHIIKVELM